MQAAPRVSVIIPTYNHRAFIRRTLDSVFNQTMQQIEILVINDGSPDDTRDVLAPVVASGRIQYFEQDNAGQSRARNNGIRRARGEYIAFLDDDDLWPEDKLEWQVKYLDEHPDVGVVGGTLQRIDESDSPGAQGSFHPTITLETLFVVNPFYSPGQTLIRADLLNALEGMNAKIWGADDWDLWFRVVKRARIVMLDRLALYYRIHAGNASKQIARLLNACCETIDQHLADLSPGDRDQLRAESQRTIYNGLGSMLVASAKDQLRRGKALAALRLLGGLRPLARSIFSDSAVRSAFLSDVRHR